MSVHIQTGNMLDVVVEGKSLGLKQRDSDHREYEVIWLPDPESLAMVLLAELKRFKPAPDNMPEPPTELRAAVRKLVDDCGNRTGSHEDFRNELIDRISTFVAARERLRDERAVRLIEEAQCECEHLKTRHDFFSDHDECQEYDPMSPNLCCEYREVTDIVGLILNEEIANAKSANKSD